MKQMAEQFSVQMADSFEKVITPTFQKMNDSLDMLVSSVTRCQEDAIREISDEFLKQMNNSFHMQFRDFNVALDQLKKAQKENTAYTSAMYQTMSQKLSETYDKQDKAITDMVREMGGSRPATCLLPIVSFLRIRRFRRCSSRIISILWII